MKKFIALLASISFGAIASTNIIPASVDQLFVPKGFDDNDNVEMTVSGKLTNSCYSRHMATSTVEGKTINVKVTSLFSDRANCDKYGVPFTENLTLGNLSDGTYNVVVNGKEMGNLKVDPARTDNVDNHIYAQVDYVELGFTGGLSGTAMLVGKNVASCLELDRVEYLSNGKDTLSILPIMKKKEGNCDESRDYLEIPIKFDLTQFPADKTLLFVRTMDGKSVSSLITK